MSKSIITKQEIATAMYDFEAQDKIVFDMIEKGYNYDCSYVDPYTQLCTLKFSYPKFLISEHLDKM